LKSRLFFVSGFWFVIANQTFEIKIEMTNLDEIWQVEVNNQTYEANVQELGLWIAEGALLPSDRVRRGNLRWLEARKVPVLHQFFNAAERGLPLPVLQNVTDAADAENGSPLETESLTAAPTIHQNQIAQAPENFAATELPAEFAACFSND
jgi:hypothetical protein